MRLYAIGISVFTMLVSFIPVCKGQEMRKTIEIHDNQYDCYNSTEYTLTDSTIHIDNYAEEGNMYDSGYTPKALLDKKLSKTKRHLLADFMEHFPFDSLKSEYISGAEKSCDSLRQIYIEINWNGKNKNIQIEDCYQNNVGMLFDMINLLIPKEEPKNPMYNPDLLRFDYTPDRFQCRN